MKAIHPLYMQIDEANQPNLTLCKLKPQINKRIPQNQCVAYVQFTFRNITSLQFFRLVTTACYNFQYICKNQVHLYSNQRVNLDIFAFQQIQKQCGAGNFLERFQILYRKYNNPKKNLSVSQYSLQQEQISQPQFCFVFYQNQQQKIQRPRSFTISCLTSCSVKHTKAIGNTIYRTQKFAGDHKILIKVGTYQKYTNNNLLIYQPILILTIDMHLTNYLLSVCFRRCIEFKKKPKQICNLQQQQSQIPRSYIELQLEHKESSPWKKNCSP
eukprot:TRINITY_DN6707_c0_g2_i1.p2 TRINITY_DN6707_c0_g2~~TRINITY_DN6707_c0_g2_i1.p2  ORF type:complete len:270 (+),score=-12.20 TRINITY_DN6707_c0_g2_i1:272-1081(+)